MDEETYNALKRLMKHCTDGGPNDNAFWNDIRQVEGWISEVEKDYNN